MEISSGQSQEWTTFFMCKKHHLSNQRSQKMFFHCSEFPATCVVSQWPLSSSIHSARRFVLRKVVVGPIRFLPYRKWYKNPENGRESIHQLHYFSKGLSGESWKQIRMSNCWKNVLQMKTRRARCLFCLSLKDEWKCFVTHDSWVQNYVKNMGN